MRRPPRAPAPGAPALPVSLHTGRGSCRGMESSGPPPARPRTFPHPSEILAARPPPARISAAPTAATTGIYTEGPTKDQNNPEMRLQEDHYTST